MRIWKNIAIGTLLLADTLRPPNVASAQRASFERPTIRFAVPLSVIVSALAENGLVVEPERIQLAFPISATTAAPALRLTAAELRQDGSLLMRLACRNIGECLSFYAAVPMPDREETLAFLAKLHGGDSALFSQRSAGVIVGAHLTLHLSDAQMHIRLPVVAIDAGLPGSEIRVASMDRKHTYRGVVADISTVKGGLQ